MLFTTFNRLTGFVYSLAAKVNLHKLIPLYCLLCHHTTASDCNICLKCEQDLPMLPHGCQQCAQILQGQSYHISMTCGTCLKNPPAVDQTYALFSYQPPVAQFIIRLKFQRQLIYAETLGKYFAKQIKKTWYRTQSLPDLILPVPLHHKRLQERGFNQALEIARPIAKRFHLPIDISGITRHRHTKAQSELHARERKKNIAGAFSAHRDYTGLSIAIMDDVMTTAHTVFELAKLLKQQGAKHVVVWCCARTE